MGFSMYSLDVPVVKGSSSLLVFQEDVVSKIESSACIRCGRCGEGCPSNLLPAKLASFAAKMMRLDLLSLMAWSVSCVEAVLLYVPQKDH